jgi:tRNA A37 threonylcarbamoyladenosine biosynthesis protein TsaE
MRIPRIAGQERRALLIHFQFYRIKDYREKGEGHYQKHFPLKISVYEWQNTLPLKPLCYGNFNRMIRRAVINLRLSIRESNGYTKKYQQ